MAPLLVLVVSVFYLTDPTASAAVPEPVGANVTDHLFWQKLIQSVDSGEKSATESTTVALHNDETIAVIQYSGEKVTHCRLIEVNTQLKQKKAISELSETMSVHPIDMLSMVYLISSCQKFQSDQSAVEVGQGRAAKSETGPLPWAFLTAIMPGTKWCGPGDVAQSYDDLGPLTEMDKCCRAHDHCPLKVKGMRSAHGLVNLSFYTKSHCACDDEFFNCLKAVEKPMTKMLGNLYFNVLQVPCIDEDTSKFEGDTYSKLELLPDICKRRDDDVTCPYLIQNPFGVKKYKFVNVHRRF